MITEAPPVAVPPRRELTPAQLRLQTRLWCAFMVLVCGGMLGVGLWLKPSPKGIGTHAESLPLLPCGLYVSTGFPCPTCGCTTAVSHVAHLNIVQGFITQPFGAFLGVLAWVLLGLGIFGLFTGRWVGPQPFTIAWHWRAIVVFGVSLLVGAWVYKAIMLQL